MTGNGAAWERQGWWLEVARRVADLTQTEAAIALGWKASTSLRDYETGLREPKADLLRRMARLYKVPAAELLAVPDETDLDRMRRIRDAHASDATRLAHEDQLREEAQGPDAAGPPVSRPRRPRERTPTRSPG